MKKIVKSIAATIMAASILTACGGSDKISVVSREEGSGTRGAFVELTHVEQKNEQGKKVDMTTANSEITNATSVMIATVISNKNAIGYISLGSLNNDVKAVKINGVEATVANTMSGSYTIRRPFNLVLKNEQSNPLVKDFIKFILSNQGQEIVAKKGYVPMNSAVDYQPSQVEGKISIAGSSSVTPVMESLKEAYLKLNSKAYLEIQQSDSTTGVTTVIEGISDIGMSSREITEAEKAKGVTPLVIALDGIAVIINKENKVDNLSVDNVRDIYMGNLTDWSALAK